MDILKKIINLIKMDNHKERNRLLVLLVALLFIFDYLIFCYHTEKNPFDIFPSLPIKDEKIAVNIYLPGLDGKNLIKETKKIPKFDDANNFIQLLFYKIIEGSEYENTTATVPVETYIRKIWVYNKICIIDAGFSLLTKNTKIIKGSEKTFIKALSKTIIENVPSIKKVILLDKGIPNKKIWEI